MSNHMFRNRNRNKCDAYCDDSPCDLKFLKEIYGDRYHKSDVSKIRCGDNFCNKDYDCKKIKVIEYVDKGKNTQLTNKDTHVSYSQKIDVIILPENPCDGQYISINLSKNSGMPLHLEYETKNEVNLATFDGNSIKTKISGESKPYKIYYFKSNPNSKWETSLTPPEESRCFQCVLKYENTLTVQCDNMWSFIYYDKDKTWKEE